MEAVAEAARKAKFNEAIVVNVSNEDAADTGETREIVLTATLDEENGGVVWNQVTGRAEGEDVGIVRHLRTKQWVLPMLNDRPRNEKYDKAIQAASCEAVRRFKGLSDESTIHALDIGAGTGLLAMMTSKHLHAALKDADCSAAVKVTSLEMAAAMARLGKLTIASNDLKESIGVLEQHSCEVRLRHKCIMCTSELLESGLLGEGILPSLRDAWERHLHPNAVVVPQKARVYAQLIEGKELIGNFCGPHLPTQSADSDCCSPLRLSTRTSMNGNASVLLEGNIIVPIHAESLFSSDPLARVLTDPIEVLGIDFSSQAIPGPEGQRRSTRLVPISSGTAHGVLFWWELDLWDDISYSTQAGKEQWQDHWQQCLFVLEEPMSLVGGEGVSLTCSHTDDRLSFTLEKCVSDTERDSKRQRLQQVQDTSQLISPQRALQLNNADRIAVIRRAIQFALKDKRNDANFLDMSDFSLCAILAALEGAACVSSLESSSGETPMTAARVSQANGLPRTVGETVAQYQILQCHAGSLTNEVLNNNPASIVAAEPYYEVLEGWHLAEAMNFFYLVKSLRNRGLVENDTTTIPSYASIMVCGIQCEKLAQAYQGCGDDDSPDARICGFKHSEVKHYGDRYHEKGLSIRACEYDYVCLTETRQSSRLCFESSSIIDNNVAVRLKFQKAGTCHGVLLWVDYGMKVDRSSYRILSTNDGHHRQLFQLLPRPHKVSNGDLEQSRLECRIQVGALGGVEDHRLKANIINY